MKNLYNKGKFRGFEYGKIPPYLKTLGNKRWRRTAPMELRSLESEEASLPTNIQLPQKNSKTKARIKVKITFLEYNQKKTSRYLTYKSVKALQDSMKKNTVMQVVFKTNGFKTKNQEK